MRPEIYGENFNIGTGRKTTIADLAELSGRLFGIKEEPRFGTLEGRAWDMPDWYADPRKAIDKLGWAPEVSLEDGLRRTAEWVKTLSDGLKKSAVRNVIKQ